MSGQQQTDLGKERRTVPGWESTEDAIPGAFAGSISLLYGYYTAYRYSLGAHFIGRTRLLLLLDVPCASASSKSRSAPNYFFKPSSYAVPLGVQQHRTPIITTIHAHT